MKVDRGLKADECNFWNEFEPELQSFVGELFFNRYMNKEINYIDIFVDYFRCIVLVALRYVFEMTC